MSEITDIVQQKKDINRVSVFLDGVFCCGMKYETALKFGLKKGMTLDEEKLSAIQLEAEKDEALDKCFTHLSNSLKTERQMRDFLSKKGYLTEVTEYCIEKCKYYGYVDDEAYCKEYIRCSKGLGNRKIADNLFRRGIDRDIIQKALEEREETEQDILPVLEKYMRYKAMDKVNKKKAFNFLLSKGYSASLIKDVIEKFFGPGPDGEGGDGDIDTDENY